MNQEINVGDLVETDDGIECRVTSINFLNGQPVAVAVPTKDDGPAPWPVRVQTYTKYLRRI